VFILIFCCLFIVFIDFSVLWLVWPGPHFWPILHTTELILMNTARTRLAPGSNWSPDLGDSVQSYGKHIEPLFLKICIDTFSISEMRNMFSISPKSWWIRSHLGAFKSYWGVENGYVVHLCIYLMPWSPIGWIQFPESYPHINQFSTKYLSLGSVGERFRSRIRV